MSLVLRFAILILAAWPASLPGATFVVTTTSDLGDANPPDGLCDIDPNVAGPQCSLRAALENATVNPGEDFIHFSIAGTPPHVISVGLPYGPSFASGGAVTIDATTQPGYAGTPLVQLVDSNIFLFGSTALDLRGDNSTVRGLAISGFERGIHLTGNASLVANCFIGTDTTGTVAAGNTLGIELGGTNALIGPNLISGNERGILVSSFGTCENNRIEGNSIGTDVSGDFALGNTLGGIDVSGTCTGTMIGGPGAGQRNLISGNGSETGPGSSGPGIRITSFTGVGVATILNNIIGLGRNGDTVIPNRIGIQVEAATTIEQNVISGNAISGIQFSGISGATSHVRNNLIGTDWTGSVARPNNVGIAVLAITAPVIGFPGAGNLISGNGTGINIDSSNATVQANRMGLALNSNQPIPNGTAILVSNAANLQIGATGAGNTIANSTGPGIQVMPNARRVRISSNRVSGNAGLGIELYPPGVNSNDSDDSDAGANDLQNFPVITSVRTKFSDVQIVGSLQSMPDTVYRLEFFSSPACDASGSGEGAEFLGGADVTTDVSGSAAFNMTAPSPSPASVVTATATDPEGNTSEFSECSAIQRFDPNNDGLVDAQDVFFLLAYLFGQGISPLGIADATGDDLVDVRDVFYLINFLFSAGPAPA